MDFRTLAETVPVFIVEGKCQEAQGVLQQAYDDATRRGDLEMLEHVCALFVQLYSSCEPLQLEKAESFSLERERIKPSAYSAFQTGMVLYHVIHDARRAAEKLRDTVEKAEAENDSTTMYSARSLLGQCLLDANETTEAADVLRDIERMISARKPMVMGDETPFLEKALQREVAQATVRRIAGMLAPVCPDPTFSRRLAALAKEGSSSI